MFGQMFLRSSHHFDHLFPKKKLLVILCFLPQSLPGVSPPFNSVIHKEVSGCAFNTGLKKKTLVNASQLCQKVSYIPVSGL